MTGTTFPDGKVSDTGIVSSSEITATALAGAALGGLTLATVARIMAPHHRRNWPSMWWGMGVGAASGLLAGWQRIYQWKNWRGRWAFVADHTWALATTGAGAVMGTVNLLLGARIVESLTHRQNRLVFDRGFVLRSGYALSTGYVVSGAADRQGRMTERRRRLVTDHEDVHVWQARRWGPLYPVLYGLWFLGGSVVGLGKWRIDRARRSIMTHVDAAAYYSNPFEWRAYTEDDNWPPATADQTLVWSKRFGAERVTDSRENRATQR